MNINPVDVSTGLETIFSKELQEQEPEFRKLWDKLTGGTMAEEIRENYHVTLDVGKVGTYQQILDEHDIRCTNYVRISPGTLAKMEEDPVLKKKILKEIEQFCSREEQEKVRNLYPPVKSGGMLIYPNGNTFYWLEAYSGESDHKDSKKRIAKGQALHEISRTYQNMIEDLTEEISIPEYGILGDESVLRRSLDEEKKRSAAYI